jgi:hypothetical protein
MSPSPPKLPAVFPALGDRVQHEQYGAGTVTMLDVYHTVIDFDGHGLRRFVTHRVVVERTDDPGPTASEKRVIATRRAKEERARVKAAALVEKVPTPSRRRRNKPDPEDAPPPDAPSSDAPAAVPAAETPA